MYKTVPAILTTVLILVLAPFSTAATSSQTSSTKLLQQVKQAYQKTNQLQMTSDITIASQNNGWSTTRKGQIHLAFDRASHQLKIDQPGFYTVISNGKLRMKSALLPGQLLTTDLAKPITYDHVFKVIHQLMMNPPLINLAMLTSDKPIEAITLGTKVTLKTVQLADGKTALQFPNGKSTVTLTIDPKTHLIENMKVIADPKFLSTTNGVDSLEINSAYTIKTRNQDIPQNAFQFDADGLTPATSIKQMAQNLRNKNAASSGNRTTSGAKSMEGKPMPRLTLKTLNGKSFDSSKVKAKVMVLDLWATWCGPCVNLGLPLLQDTYLWAKKNNKDVAIYAVNQGESNKIVKKFWDNTSYDMPVLMDPGNVVGTKFHVRAIPTTLIIADGKVQAVEVGVSPNSKQKLREEINKALGQ